MNGITRFPEKWRLALWGLIAIFAAIVLPFLLFLVARIFYRFPMDYNEGWNVMFTARLLAGGPLYVPLDDFPLTPMNYPPLSFAIIGGLSYFTGDILLTGRIVSLCSSLIVSLLIFRIIDNVTGQKSAATFCALFWLGLMTRLGGYRLVMHDPQLLAHAFSLAALCLFSEWRDALTPRRVCLLALLCCLALFVKHLVFVVPVVVAIALFSRDKKVFWTFALAGIVFSAIMAYASWQYGGRNLLASFLDLWRAAATRTLIFSIRRIFFAQLGFVVFAPFFLLLVNRRKIWIPYLAYFYLSLALGAYAARGVGVDINAWFDFFIAAAIVFGIFAGSLSLLLETSKPLSESIRHFGRLAFIGLLENKWRPVIVYGVLISALLPLSLRLGRVPRAPMTYEELRRSEQAYQKQVELLRSIPGPALFESLLLGFDAGKEFLYDPFGASQLMVSGRIREMILTDAIRRKIFGAIVLKFNLDDAVCKLRERAVDERKPSATVRERWTDNTLEAIGEHYDLLGPGQFRNYFYVPRNTDAKTAPLCPPRRDA
jgi:hypothetical protein